MLGIRQSGGRVVALIALPLVILAAVALLLQLASPAAMPAVTRLAVAGLGLSIIWSLLLGADLVRAIGVLTTSDPSPSAEASSEPIRSPATESPSRPTEQSSENNRSEQRTDGQGGSARDPRSASEATASPETAFDSLADNLALFDDQLEVLDELERYEEDPERLSMLFELDHSVARLRRAARGLAVLTEPESVPAAIEGDTESVPLIDVITGALSSVEHFERVRVGAVVDEKCSAGAAEDLTHMLAEVLDVSIRLSPANRPVEVVALRSDSADKLLVHIVDGGDPKAKKRLKAANEIYQNPQRPPTDLDEVGLAVATRLAERVGASLVAERGRKGTTLTTIAVPGALFSPSQTANHKSLRPTSAADADQASQQAQKSDIHRSAGGDPDGGRSAAGSWRAKLGRLGRRDTRQPEHDDAAGSEAPRPDLSHRPASSDQGSREDQGPSSFRDDRGHQPELTEQSPQSLAEALPSGPAFDAGLAELLTDQTTQAENELPKPPPAADTGLPGDTTNGPTTPRAPHELRSRLHRYRKGLQKGRDDQQAEPDTPDGQGTDEGNQQ